MRCAFRESEKLIGGLGGERTRWTESCASLELSYAKLVGDALISAATIAYTGAFTPTFRKSMTDHWQTRRARQRRCFHLSAFPLCSRVLVPLEMILCHTRRLEELRPARGGLHHHEDT